MKAKPWSVFVEVEGVVYSLARQPKAKGSYMVWDDDEARPLVCKSKSDAERVRDLLNELRVTAGEPVH